MAEHLHLQNEIVGIFSGDMNISIPSVDDDLLEKGILDSMTFVDLLVRLETRYGLKVAMDDLEIDHFRSVSKIALFVARNSGNNGHA